MCLKFHDDRTVASFRNLGVSIEDAFGSIIMRKSDLRYTLLIAGHLSDRV